MAVPRHVGQADVIVVSDSEDDAPTARAARAAPQVDAYILLSDSEDEKVPAASSAEPMQIDSQDENVPAARGAALNDAATESNDNVAPAAAGAAAEPKKKKARRSKAEMLLVHQEKERNARTTLEKAMSAKGIKKAKASVKRHANRVKKAKKKAKNNKGKHQASPKKRQTKPKDAVVVNQANNDVVGSYSDVMGAAGARSDAQASSPRPLAPESQPKPGYTKQKDEYSSGSGSESDPSGGSYKECLRWRDQCKCDIKHMRQCKCKARPPVLVWWNGKWQRDFEEKLNSKAVKDKLADVNKLNPQALRALKTLPCAAGMQLLLKVEEVRPSTNMDDFIIKNAAHIRNQWGLDDVSSSSSSENEDEEDEEDEEDDEDEDA